MRLIATFALVAALVFAVSLPLHLGVDQITAYLELR
jgi:hypothetical protein